MKKMLWTVILAMGLFLIWVAPSNAEVIKLSLADQNPQTGWGPSHALQPWAKKVEEATKNRVKIDIYPSQTLVKGVDTWEAVKTGVADIGWCHHGYWADMTPLYDVITLPGLPFTTGEQASEAMWKLYLKTPALQREFKDVHVLQLWASPPRFLITGKKQVKTMEDLKGMKIRVPGGPATDEMRNLGAVPVMIPMPDNYQSLQKGVIDGMDTSWDATFSFRLYEVVKYYTFVPLSSTHFSMVMNPSRWNSLPKDIREAITSVSGLDGAKWFGRNWYDTAQSFVEEHIKKEGFQMISYTIPTEESDRWKKVGAEPVWKEWVKKVESKGRPEAQQVLNALLELAK